MKFKLGINPFILKILSVLLFISTIVAIGTIGYLTLEDYNLLDAIYMTVITLTTTGFGEVNPLSHEGKIFTMILLLTGMGVITYSLSSIINYIVSIDFTQRRRQKMEKRIKTFRNHTIVCGFGRMGEIICKRLKDEGIKFVVIEKNHDLIASLEKTDYHFVEGDSAQDDVLEKASIKKAKVLVSVIDNDADGLYITLSARSYNPDLQIIVRANEPNAKQRMLRAGANKVVLPYVMSGLKVAESVINPAVEDFLNIDHIKGEEGSVDLIQLADLYVSRDSSLKDRNLKDIGEDIQDLIIVGIRKVDRTFMFNPRGEYKFEEGDCIIAMAEQNVYKKTMEKFRLVSQPPFPEEEIEAA